MAFHRHEKVAAAFVAFIIIAGVGNELYQAVTEQSEDRHVAVMTVTGPPDDIELGDNSTVTLLYGDERYPDMPVDDLEKIGYQVWVTVECDVYDTAAGLRYYKDCRVK